MVASVLVVDDSEVNLVVADSKLTEAGYAVTTVADGSSALSALRIEDGPGECPFDAVLLDIMMPDIDGLDVLVEIRKVHSPIQLPVLMATARSRSEDIIEALSLGANDYITKPIDLPLLEARLKTHLHIKAVYEELRMAQQSIVSAARIESVGFLAAGVAHEIRNPLGRIQMSIGGLKSLIDRLPEDVRETGEMIAETVEESIDSADRIVQSLMRATEEQRLSLDETDLNEFLEKEFRRLQPDFEKSKIRAKLELGRIAIPVPLSEEKFRGVLDAVVKNAIQALAGVPESERELRISTEEGVFSGVEPKQGGRSGNRLRSGDKVAIIRIEDNGPGMSEEEMESAFDAFYSTKATGVGTGMGLTVARKQIELHNGLIQTRSRADGKPGLCVIVMLKLSGGFRTKV